MIAQIIKFVSNEDIATPFHYSLIAAILSVATICTAYLIMRGFVRHRNPVQEGQCYAKVLNLPGRTNHFNVCLEPSVWEVQSVSADHAWLVNQEDLRDIRRVSCSALADGRFFKLQT